MSEVAIYNKDRAIVVTKKTADQLVKSGRWQYKSIRGLSPIWMTIEQEESLLKEYVIEESDEEITIPNETIENTESPIEDKPVRKPRRSANGKRSQRSS